MKNASINNSRLIALAIGLALMAGKAQAGAVNITIGDPQVISETATTPAATYNSSWYKGGTGPLSDYQEVEPGMSTGSAWDLAAFTADTTAKTLGIVSGYELKNGFSGTTLGDIFVSANPPVPVSYPEGTNYPQFVKNGALINGGQAMNWDFAIQLNWTSASGGTYRVYALDANSVLENGEYNATNGSGQIRYNAASMPWKLASTSTANMTGANVGHGTGNGYGVDTLSTPKNYGAPVVVTGNTFTYSTTNGANAASQLVAGVGSTSLLSGKNLAPVTDYKYYLELQNMGWLASYQSANFADYFHTTMWCGNDDLWGATNVGYQRAPDGGMTLVLLGLGLAGIVGLAAKAKRS